MRPSVLIADDHRLYALSLRSLLSPFYEVVAVAQDGRELVKLAVQHRPDVIVTDISMPVMNGLDAIEELSRLASRSKFVVLTMHQEVGLAVLAFRYGASGFLLKTGRGSELIKALSVVLEGGRYLSPDFPKSLDLVLAEAALRISSVPRP